MRITRSRSARLQNTAGSPPWARNLNTGPNDYRKHLFIDHQLKPGDIFSDDLVARVENSTLLLLLLSQNYIDSTWCGKELEHFIRTHANDPDKPADVFVVKLFPFETFSNVPANIQNLCKRLIHAQFWHQLANSSAPILGGDPSPQECSAESGRHYWLKLHELRNAIDSRLRTMRRDQPSVPVAAPKDDPLSAISLRSTKEPLGTILLADTTDDLVAQRDAVKARLEPEGIVVLPAGDYVGLAPEEFKTELARDLAKSQLFVQLLSPTVAELVRDSPRRCHNFSSTERWRSNCRSCSGANGCLAQVILLIFSMHGCSIQPSCGLRTAPHSGMKSSHGCM
jgi:hypothetical protein